MSNLIIRQSMPPGAALRMKLDPSSIVEGGGAGGWSEVGHVKRPSSTEFQGQPLRTLELPLLFDAWRDGGDVEEPLRILRVWGGIQPGQRTPARLQVVYGTYTPLRWVLQDLTWGPELRNKTGRRVRAEVTVSLLEWRDAVIGLSPAQQVRPAPAATPGRPSSGAAPAPSGKTYKVKAGDTLSKIAQTQMGNASRWPEIARLNGLRDPNRITVGQTLRIPA